MRHLQGRRHRAGDGHGQPATRGTVVIIRDVPAAICEDCGEYYLDEDVATKVYGQGEDAVQRHAEVEILRYAA
jgi:hypothetical protein